MLKINYICDRCEIPLKKNFFFDFFFPEVFFPSSKEITLCNKCKKKLNAVEKYVRGHTKHKSKCKTIKELKIILKKIINSV